MSAFSLARGPPLALYESSLRAAKGVGVKKSDFIVLIALAHYDLDASKVSLDDVYKGLNGDRETYYFLWVAVRKVLAEAPNVMLDLFKILVVPVGKYELIWDT